MVKRIAVMGSTGSIGRQTLEVIEHLGPGYQLVALAAESSAEVLAEQARRFKPELAVLGDEKAASDLACRIENLPCRVESGSEGLHNAATMPSADLVVMAQVGFSGFASLVDALKAGKIVALANKESLVVGGEILQRLGLLDREKLLPIDSEHSAIWQCLGANDPDQVSKVYLTASGGPFYGYKKEELDQVTPGEALKHPNWKMGSKITIDSATMMNKGLEVIEAGWLFDLALEQIEVIIHRQSIVHSMVKYIDGTIIAQLGAPDMRLPIQYALTYPERLESRTEKYNPFGQTLTFERPDRDNFPCLELACRAAREGGTMPAVLNGANERAVKYFLEERIGFNGIAELIGRVMDSHRLLKNPDIEDVIEADRWSRRKAEYFIDG